MKASELRSKDAAELGKELESLLKAQFGLRMQKTQQLANTSQLRNVRRDIARVRTLLTEKAGEIKMSETQNTQVAKRQRAGWQGRQQQDGQDCRRARRAPRQAPIFGKIIMRSAKYKAHDESNQYEGDTVEIAEGRPISRSKSWRVVRLVEAARII